MEKNCSQSTWNRPIEFFLSTSHSQHSSASIFWVFSLSATCGFGGALLLRALGQQYCCDLLFAPDSEITRVWWPSSVYALIVVELYLLVMLRLRFTRQYTTQTKERADTSRGQKRQNPCPSSLGASDMFARVQQLISVHDNKLRSGNRLAFFGLY